VRFSLRVNNDVTVAQFVRMARAGDEHGFDQLWVSNDLFLRSAPVLLTAAGATKRLHLGAGILNPYSLHPAEIAMIAATLQEATGGRFLLGLAAGAEDFLGWAGMERSQPLRRTREALVAVRTLLAGERPAAVDGAGQGWTDEAYLRFGATPTPIYVGSMGPRMQAMAGEVADGVLPLLFPPEHFPVAAAHVREGATQAGRTLGDLDLAACVWVSIDADADAARGVLAEKIAYYGPSFSPYLLERAGLSPRCFDGIKMSMAAGDVAAAVAQVTEPMLRLGIAGDAAGVRKRCEWLVDAGAHHLSFGPPLGPDPLAAIRELGEKVLPAFR
jgi:5,10-methylenetetrahydromethanopterin reductase